MTLTVKQFLRQSYQLVSASNPTIPLRGYDDSDGLMRLNLMINAYTASGLLTPIAKHVTYNLSIGQQEVTFGSATTVPTPDVTDGRLSNIQNAWLLLNGVTYPLIVESRNVFLGSYKYDPQQGLPRFAIIYNETNLTRLRIYPSASQAYELNIYAKFQPTDLTLNSDMSSIPDYNLLFLQLDLAKQLAFYKGRSEAWTDKLEAEWSRLKKDIEGASSVNLAIQSPNESYLNGAWRIRAGV